MFESRAGRDARPPIVLPRFAFDSGGVIISGNFRGKDMVVLFDSSEKSARELKSGVTVLGAEIGNIYGDFQARLRQEVVRSKRKEHAFTVMRVSVDFPTEDEDPDVAQILKATIREYDVFVSA